MEECAEADEPKKQAKAAGLLKKEQAQARRRQQQQETAAKKKQHKIEDNKRRQQEQEQQARAQAELTTAGLDVQWNLQFTSPAEDVAVCLDIWRDPLYAEQLLPAVLWLHGGGWKFGTHHTMPSFLRSLTSAGYAIVSVDYRKTGTAPFPACIDDCKAAVKWVRKYGAETGLAPQQVAVLGSSAGAHLAALLGVTGGEPAVEGAELETHSSPVSAVVAIAGPMDLNKSCEDHQSPSTLEAFLLGGPVASCPSAAAAASPITHINQARQIPPFLLIHGDADDEVPLAQSEAFLEALCTAGAPADLIRIPSGNHPIFGEVRGGGVNNCLESAKSSWDAALNGAIVDFFRHHIPPKV